MPQSQMHSLRRVSQFSSPPLALETTNCLLESIPDPDNPTKTLHATVTTWMDLMSQVDVLVNTTARFAGVESPFSAEDDTDASFWHLRNEVYNPRKRKFSGIQCCSPAVSWADLVMMRQELIGQLAARYQADAAGMEASEQLTSAIIHRECCVASFQRC